MISSPSVNEVKLPFEAVDGTHYVTFRDSDDLVEKVKYYMEHADEREEIVKNGRQLFKEEYNFHKHGNYIVKQLKGILLSGGKSIQRVVIRPFVMIRTRLESLASPPLICSLWLLFHFMGISDGSHKSWRTNSYA